ncbi:MAG: SRPBCC family protein [Acidimicrobiales bacterium]
MTACARVKLTGSIEVALPLRQAFALFTPNGERAWARGWTPEFPGAATDDTEPGVVFETGHAGYRSIWTVVRFVPGTAIGYSVATPGDRAGTVTVSCQPSTGGTTVTVGYDLTALKPEANGRLYRFEAHYADFLDDWEQSIAQVIASGSAREQRCASPHVDCDSQGR